MSEVTFLPRVDQRPKKDTKDNAAYCKTGKSCKAIGESRETEKRGW
jgi:hypothetical protein